MLATGVRQARLAADDRIHHLVAHSACVCREFDKTLSVRRSTSGCKATDIVRQTGWQHWDHLVWEIDAGAALGRLTVHETAFVRKNSRQQCARRPHMPIGEKF
jgi:hypothetical protein